MPFVFVSGIHPELSIICRNGLDLDLTCFETFLLISYFTSEIKIKNDLRRRFSFVIIGSLLLSKVFFKFGSSFYTGEHWYKTKIKGVNDWGET